MQEEDLSTIESTAKTTAKKEGGEDVESGFTKGGAAMRLKQQKKEEELAANFMEGVEGFKMVGNNKKLEIKNTSRTQELFNAMDIFDNNEGDYY